jgi:hypothetical protein
MVDTRTQNRDINEIANIKDFRERLGVPKNISLGVIEDNLDEAFEHAIAVRIPATQGRSSQIVQCMWCSPFAGTTPYKNLSDDIEDPEGAVQAYGLWMQPPDIGNHVVVAFGDGDSKFGLILSCIFPGKFSNSIPGQPSVTTYQDSAVTLPSTEISPKEGKPTTNDRPRPIEFDLSEAVVKQGLALDPIRGFGSSGSRREAPSDVYGILTPGALNKGGKKGNVRGSGHQFIMDDHPKSKLIRLRTGGGAQILLDDTTGSIFLINQKGSAKMEFKANGQIDIFGENSINIRSMGDLNLRAEYNLNLEAGQNVHVTALGDNIGGQRAPGGAVIQGIAGDITGPLGTGGEIKLDSASDMHFNSSRNSYLTASTGDVNINSGGSTLVTTGANSMSTGTGNFEVVCPAGRVTMLTGIGFDVITSAINMFGGLAFNADALVMNLNSFASTPTPPVPPYARPAAETAKGKKKLAPEDAAEFDRDSDAPLTTGGKRTGIVHEIMTTLTRLPGPEPDMHYNYDPEKNQLVPSDIAIDTQNEAVKAAYEKVENATQGEGTVDPGTGKGSDVQTPSGTQVAVGAVDSAGKTVTDLQNSITGAADQAMSAANQIAGAGNALLNSIPTFAGLAAVYNEFKEMAKDQLLQITGLNDMTAAFKAMLPPVRFAVSNPELEKVIGMAKNLTEIEARLRAFALEAGIPVDLLEGQVQELMGDINSIKSQFADINGIISDVQGFTDALQAQGISVIQDAGGFIFEDANGFQIVDFSNGLGPIGETVGFIGDMNKSYESVKSAVKTPLSNNQRLAVASFAHHIGPERFLNSNVLRAINEEKFEVVPYLMKGWTMAPSEPGGDMETQDTLVQMRAYEAEVFQTSDEQGIGLSRDYPRGGAPLGELAEDLYYKRQDFHKMKFQGDPNAAFGAPQTINEIKAAFRNFSFDSTKI